MENQPNNKNDGENKQFEELTEALIDLIDTYPGEDFCERLMAFLNDQIKKSMFRQRFERKMNRVKLNS